jgi:hypothetical protein
MGARLALVDAPKDFRGTLGDLPDDVTVLSRPTGPIDVIVYFVTERAALAKRFSALAGALRGNGGFWIAWPKKASGVATDLNENIIRDIGLEVGLVDNKVCAIDDVWSGLRFVYRLKDRKTATGK